MAGAISLKWRLVVRAMLLLQSSQQLRDPGKPGSRRCGSKRGMAFGIIALLLASQNSCSCRNNKPTGPSTATNASTSTVNFTDEIIARHNRGVALMGRFDYAEAHKIFQQLAIDHPNWPDVQVDLAIATLNRREPGDSEKALALLQKVAEADPKNLRAYYCQGILALDGGDPENALKAFQHVSREDPKDAYAVYYTGQCMSQLSDIDGALEQFLKVIDLDPYLRSAYYGAFQGLLRTGQMQDANQYRVDFERLADNPQARLAEIKYTRMGPKASVLPIRTKTSNDKMPEGSIFNEQTTQLVDLPDNCNWNQSDQSITFCDIDMDGDTDLFVANGVQVNGAVRNAVLLNDDDAFSIALDHPLTASKQINAVLWGDFDNDGFIDAYFCRDGRNELWRQSANNTWTNVTESTGTGGGETNTLDGAFVDADHDGDLDIFLANDGLNELLSNNLDGTFRKLGEEYKLAGPRVRSTSVLFADFDNDRDADIIVVNESAPHQVLLNDRLWSYHEATKFDDLIGSQFTAAVSADADVDGQLEIYTASPTGIERWQPDANGDWKSASIALGFPTAHRLEAADVQGDGDIELIVHDEGGHHVLSIAPASPNSGKAIESIAPLAKPIIAPLSNRGPVLLGFDVDGALSMYGPGDGRYSFLNVTFSGKENQGEQMRSNRSGIGVDVAVRRGVRWTAFNTFRPNSGPGQSHGPVQVGLGATGKLDFVQLTWPDGVFQTEIDVPNSQTHRIEETQRQVASCPVIFAWNGEQFEFVTDVLGVGGIGFNLGKGEYSSPRPWENLLLTPESLQPASGQFDIRIGEPMEEACYLDAARLIAYDLPLGWHITLDERLGIADPQPTGCPLFYRTEQLAVAAVNDRGNNVLSEISDTDFVAAEPGTHDSRFLGRTAEHSITLTFEKPIVGKSSAEPYLLFDGWIEYPYSQTMFAAWQANASFDAPTLEAKDAYGNWQIVAKQFGYMAGMPRRSAFPIPVDKLPPGTRELRLSCNIELYWDRISVIYAEPCPMAIKTELPLKSATVAESGYATRTTLEQRRPHYDYSRRIPMWDCRHMTGFYSSFGDAMPLVESIDDAVAIIGPGEEVRLSYSAELAEAPSNGTRNYVLELNGWAKDKDLYTRDGDTIGPLPVRDESGDTTARDDLHKRFNQRFRTGT